MVELKIGKAEDAMDWLTFIASVIGSVAWPVAAFAIAFLFRSQIRKLLSRMKKLSVGDNSVDFGERLDDAEAVAETVPSPSNHEPDGIGLLDERTAQLIKLSPAAAVIDAWRSIELDVRWRASPLEARFTTLASVTHPTPFRHGAKILLDAGQITASTYALLMDLNQLRNSAAHGGDISAADAIRFTKLAKQAKFFLDGPDVRPDNPDSISES